MTIAPWLVAAAAPPPRLHTPHRAVKFIHWGQ